MESAVYGILGFCAGLMFHQVFALGGAIRRVEQRVARISHAMGIDTSKPLPLSERVKELARDPGRKIEAIKVYRDETGAGLAEAKSAVEAYIANPNS